MMPHPSEQPSDNGFLNQLVPALVATMPFAPLMVTASILFYYITVWQNGWAALAGTLAGILLWLCVATLARRFSSPHEANRSAYGQLQIRFEELDRGTRMDLMYHSGENKERSVSPEVNASISDLRERMAGARSILKP
jgi:hypothetical protein